MISFLKNNKFLCLIALFDFILIGCFFIYDSYAYPDTFEHLRASWLVGLGKVPYRDFFEHHHPLLWYMFAPIIFALPQNVLLAFYAAKLLTVIASVLTFYAVYLLFKNFLGGTKLFWYFLLCAFIFFPVLYGFSLFKPETFARAAYAFGLYLFFKYARNRQAQTLISSGLCFCISFFFIQTAVFNILPLALPLLMLCFKNRRCLVDLLCATGVCGVVLGAACGLLYYGDAWSRYYETNWIFNAHLFDFIHHGDPVVIWFWLPHYCAAFGAGVWIYKKQSSFYYNTLFWLFVCALVQHFCLPAVYPHYLIGTSVLAAILTAPVVENLLTSQFRVFIYIFLLLSVMVNGMTFFAHFDREKFNEMMIVNQNSDDQVINFNFSAINIYAPQISYYVLFNNLHYVDDLLFHFQPDYDVNNLIADYQPRYINIAPENIVSPYSERFSVQTDIMNNYRQISSELYQRIDTLPENQ